MFRTGVTKRGDAVQVSGCSNHLTQRYHLGLPIRAASPSPSPWGRSVSADHNAKKGKKTAFSGMSGMASMNGIGGSSGDAGKFSSRPRSLPPTKPKKKKSKKKLTSRITITSLKPGDHNPYIVTGTLSSDEEDGDGKVYQNCEAQYCSGLNGGQHHVQIAKFPAQSAPQQTDAPGLESDEDEDSRVLAITADGHANSRRAYSEERARNPTWDRNAYSHSPSRVSRHNRIAPHPKSGEHFDGRQSDLSGALPCSYEGDELEGADGSSHSLPNGKSSRSTSPASSFSGGAHHSKPSRLLLSDALFEEFYQDVQEHEEEQRHEDKSSKESCTAPTSTSGSVPDSKPDKSRKAAFLRSAVKKVVAKKREAYVTVHRRKSPFHTSSSSSTNSTAASTSFEDSQSGSSSERQGGGRGYNHSGYVDRIDEHIQRVDSFEKTQEANNSSSNSGLVFVGVSGAIIGPDGTNVNVDDRDHAYDYEEVDYEEEVFDYDEVYNAAHPRNAFKNPLGLSDSDEDLYEEDSDEEDDDDDDHEEEYYEYIKHHRSHGRSSSTPPSTNGPLASNHVPRTSRSTSKSSRTRPESRDVSLGSRASSKGSKSKKTCCIVCRKRLSPDRCITHCDFHFCSDVRTDTSCFQCAKCRVKLDQYLLNAEGSMGTNTDAATGASAASAEDYELMVLGARVISNYRGSIVQCGKCVREMGYKATYDIDQETGVPLP